MGYTHYWTQTRDLEPKEIVELAEALDKIRKSARVPLAGWDGTGKPEADENRIAFNGRGDDACETFQILAKIPPLETWQSPNYRGWAFCKTRGRPYDIVVTAMLTLLAAEYGYEVSSDGEAADWEAGVKLAATSLGRLFDNPLAQPVD